LNNGQFDKPVRRDGGTGKNHRQGQLEPEKRNDPTRQDHPGDERELTLRALAKLTAQWVAYQRGVRSAVRPMLVVAAE
jgi:hypothetical protein